jgi:hypothetical protein
MSVTIHARKILKSLPIISYKGHDFNLENLFRPGSNHVLSGSYVLQYLVGKEWNGDIDIYTTNIEETLEMMPTRLSKQFKHKSSEYKAQYQVYESKFDDVVVQFIRMPECKNRADIVRTINGYYDLDICKNVVYMSDEPVLETYLSISTLMKGRFTVGMPRGQTKGDAYKTWERIKKYETRGFTIVNKNEFLENALKIHDIKCVSDLKFTHQFPGIPCLLDSKMVIVRPHNVVNPDCEHLVKVMYSVYSDELAFYYPTNMSFVPCHEVCCFHKDEMHFHYQYKNMYYVFVGKYEHVGERYSSKKEESSEESSSESSEDTESSDSESSSEAPVKVPKKDQFGKFK